MVTNINNLPFVIFSSITEDTGHLILDDFFWFSNLIERFPNTRIITSETSVKNILGKYVDYKKNVSIFKDFPFLKKLNYRLHLIARLLYCEKIENSKIIFQGFDELGILFYLLRIRNRNNLLYVVPTNNISPERLKKSKWILQWMLKKIISKSNFFLYHTEFEYELIKSAICKSPILLNKCYKLKYHLIGENTFEFISKKDDSQNIISFFGPVMSSKPIADFCNLIKADNFGNGKFQYRMINVSQQLREEVIAVFGKFNNIIFINEYLVYEEYINLIQTSRYVFLPHNHLYEGKLSGILSDCISNCTPIISDNIHPVIEFFKKYGDMGFIFKYSINVDWCFVFLESQEEDTYKEYKAAMLKCKNDHSHQKIINEFIDII